MPSKHLVVALVLSHALAAAAFAQTSGTAPAAEPSAASAGEFGHFSAGEIEGITKHPRSLSGSFAVSSSKSQLPLGGSSRLFGATLGGTLVQDRVWFFASAERGDSFFAPQVAATAGVRPSSGSVNAKMITSLGERQNLSASYAASRGVGLMASGPGTVPSSFLTMHYTGIVSDSMFFTATVSQQKTTRPAFVLDQP